MPFCKITRFFLFFFLGLASVFSQKYPGKNYTSASELPNNTVRSLLVDSNNILWIGTDNGLVKKENEALEYFFEEDGLALNSCWAIAEDPNGKLWFGSYGEGLSVYDGFQFQLISEEDGLVHNEITTLSSRGGSMFVGTSHGVSRIDVETLEVFSYEVPTEVPAEVLFRVRDFIEVEGQLYVITYRTGIYRIEGPQLVKVNDHHFIYSVFVEGDSIYSSNKGYFTQSLLSEYLSPQGPPAQPQLGTSIIWDHVKTSDGRIFVGAWGIYDSDGGIYELKPDRMISRAAEFNVPSREVLSLAYDPGFEKLYIGTRDAGLFGISLDPQIKFREIQGKNILGFARTDSTSAELFNDGLLLKSAEEERKLSLLQLKQWQQAYLSITSLPLPEHQDDFYELDYGTKAEDIRFYDLKVSGEIYWLNTNVGIFAIDQKGKLQHYLPLHSEEINFTPEGKLIETNPYGGVRLYHDLEDFRYTHYRPDDPHTPTMVVNSLQKGTKTYFLSVFSGLYVWENDRFESYLEKGIWDEKKLRHITPLGDQLAISSEFGDIFLIDDSPDFRILKKIPRAAFHGNTISFLREYQGSLIIGTEKGITLYKDDKFVFLDKEQGLEQPLLSAEVSEHILKVGSNNGINRVDLTAVGDTSPLVDRIQLKEIFINNNSSPLGPVSRQEELQLAHNENTVLLRFSTNAHPYPKKLKYQYRLNDTEAWSPPSATPEIFLASLPEKDYEVAVRVLDESTGLSYTQPLLSLAILPPFYKTWWFLLLGISILLLSGYGFYKFQILQTQRFEEQKGLIQKRYEETKMEALLSQMNPHFIFNAMNSIQYYIMESDIDNASRFLGDFAKLIRLNLDHCTKPSILLTEEIEYLQAYIRVENTRFNNAIKVSIEVDPSIDLYNIEIPSMLLQTFVENVFVHAFPAGIKAPSLEISFKQPSEELLLCSIKDNGIGYSLQPKRKLHRSKGVSLVIERLALMGYEVEEAVQITSEKNKGTTVLLKLQV